MTKSEKSNKKYNISNLYVLIKMFTDTVETFGMNISTVEKFRNTLKNYINCNKVTEQEVDVIKHVIGMQNTNTIKWDAASNYVNEFKTFIEHAIKNYSIFNIGEVITLYETNNSISKKILNILKEVFNNEFMEYKVKVFKDNFNELEKQGYKININQSYNNIITCKLSVLLYTDDEVTYTNISNPNGLNTQDVKYSPNQLRQMIIQGLNWQIGKYSTKETKQKNEQSYEWHNNKDLKSKLIANGFKDALNHLNKNNSAVFNITDMPDIFVTAQSKKSKNIMDNTNTRIELFKDELRKLDDKDLKFRIHINGDKWIECKPLYLINTQFDKAKQTRELLISGADYKIGHWESHLGNVVWEDNKEEKIFVEYMNMRKLLENI